MAGPKAKLPGSISSKDLYTVREIKSRLGLSSFALLRARWNGLKVHRVSRRKFVLGKDFIEYLETRHG